MVMLRTLPDADDPRNGLEQQYDHVDEKMGPDGGQPVRFLAIVEFVSTRKHVSTQGQPPMIDVMADVVEAPLPVEAQREIRALLDKYRLQRVAQQEQLPEAPEPSVLRALPSGADADKVLAEPHGLRDGD